MTLFVVCFLIGLLLAVYVMLHGVERPGTPSVVPPHEARGEYDPSTEPSVVVNAQNIAAFLVGIGACGYLLGRFSTLGDVSVTVLALLAGAVVAAGSASLLAAWVIPGARHEQVDERYLLQGHPARVTHPIGDGTAAGEIGYEVDGRRFVVPARSWDGVSIGAGEDVAIERIEAGVAYVERWSQVEARL